MHAIGSCGSTQAEVRDQKSGFGRRFSPSTMGTTIQLRPSGLCSKLFQLLNHLVDPTSLILILTQRGRTFPPPHIGLCRNLCRCSPQTTSEVLQQCSKKACSLTLWACAFGVCQSNSSSLAPEGFAHWGLLEGRPEVL